jgi:integrase
MGIYRRGGVWWYEFVFRGQRIRESTGSASRTLAAKAERQRHSELEQAVNNVSRTKRHKLFSLAAKEWLAANKARWSESNVAIQGYNVDHLSSYFGRMLLADITAERIGRYQAKRRTETYGKAHKKTSARTVNMEIATLRMILKSNKLWSALADEVKMLPERKKVGKALSAAQAKKLLAACRQSPQPSLYTAVVVFCNTALRNGELRRARWDQVDFLRAEFQVGEAKTEGGEGRVIPLNATALQAFKSWKARWPNAAPEDFIFPSEKLVYKGKGASTRRLMTSYGTDLGKPLGSWKTAWKTAQAEAGVQARIHDLRHHAITILAESQTPISTIKAISGHLSSKMVEHYSHVRDEARRKAVDLLDSADGRAVQ